MVIPYYRIIFTLLKKETMKNQAAYVQKIEEFESKSEAKQGIASHFHTTAKNITLKDGAPGEWWIYEGCVLHPDYKLVKDGNLFELLMNNGDFRYSN